FLDHPLAVDLMFRRVVQNVQPDETGEQILELHAFFIEFRNWNDGYRYPLMRRLARRSKIRRTIFANEETGHGKCGRSRSASPYAEDAEGAPGHPEPFEGGHPKGRRTSVEGDVRDVGRGSWRP